MLGQRSVISVANQHVQITLACRWAGMDVPDSDSRKSSKIRCFAGEFSHEDGGREPAFRVYPQANNAWCFACSKFYTSVSLCAAIWDMSWEQAAIEALDRISYKPAAYAQYWQRSLRLPEPDRDAIGEALKIWCSAQVPGWAALQYDPGVSGWLARCLGLLVEVGTEEQGRQWLEISQQVMAEITGMRQWHGLGRAV